MHYHWANGFLTARWAAQPCCNGAFFFANFPLTESGPPVSSAEGACQSAFFALSPPVQGSCKRLRMPGARPLGWDYAGPLTLLGLGSEGPASKWALALCSGVLSMGCSAPHASKRPARRPCVPVAASSFEMWESLRFTVVTNCHSGLSLKDFS